MDRVEAYEQKIILEEDTESDTRLTGLSFDLSRFKPKPPVSTPKQEKPQNESFLKRKDVVEEVFKYFGGQLPRGRLWGMVTRKGPEWVREQCNIVRQEPGNKPVGKFVNLVEGCKFKTKEV